METHRNVKLGHDYLPEKIFAYKVSTTLRQIMHNRTTSFSEAETKALFSRAYHFLTMSRDAIDIYQRFSSDEDVQGENISGAVIRVFALTDIFGDEKIFKPGFTEQLDQHAETLDKLVYDQKCSKKSLAQVTDFFHEMGENIHSEYGFQMTHR